MDFSTAPAIQEMPVTSVVCEPHDGEKVKLKKDKLNLRGTQITNISRIYFFTLYILYLIG